MALITKLREKMGRLVVFAVGFAILSFVLADLLGPNSQLFGGQDTSVGEILGQNVDMQEYQSVIDELISNYEMQFGRSPSEQVMVTLREQAWELMIARIAYEEQYEKLGVTVTDDELWDMVQGKNVSPDIQNAPVFQDPNTGQFDRQRLIQFLQNLSSLPPQNQASWYMFEANLKPGRQRLKYENLIVKTDYVTQAEAEFEHKAQNSVAEVKYLYVPYYSVADSMVAVSDSELRAYLNEHEEDYQVEHTRDLKYLQFPIVPSPDDSAYFREEINSLKEEFITVEDDSIFARINSDSRDFFNRYTISNLPDDLRSRLNELESDMVIGPMTTNTGLKLYKVSDIMEDTTYFARASHILFSAEDDTDASKAEARSEARRVLREIQAGADFAEMAREYGSDGTASRGGDLGWGQQGSTWVEEFETPVFNATSEGLINRVIETEYGFHIIKVTGVKDNRVFEVATIEREISPSDETRERAFREAGLFASNAVNLSEFEENAEQDSLEVFDVEKLGKNARTIRGLGAAREIVRWLFNEASRNEVSDVFELDNAYVVAVMTGETEEGVAELEDIRTELEDKVTDQKKGDLIIERLADANGDLDSIANAYGEDATTYSMSNLNPDASSLTGVGYDPVAVGKAFGLQGGERTEPFKSENGVLIIEMQNRTDAGEVADYSSVIEQLRTTGQSQAGFKIAEAIKEYADIEDERYKFF